MSEEIRPFKISVPDSAIAALKDKLAAATFPDEVDFSDDWNYGAPLREVKRLANYWKDGFDWRAQEVKLNTLPHYMTKIPVEGFGSLDIHFIHHKSSKLDSIPLLFCHGWPGSFLEVVKVLPLLVDDNDGPSFHVVAPSLPNFGFSEGPSKKGFSIPQYAECAHELMMRLGYEKYVTQGGDWGFFITRMIGVLYPEHCLASHVNFLCVKPSVPRGLWLGFQLALRWWFDREQGGQSRIGWYVRESSGYMVLQSTKPSTLGFAITDSPVALLAWIYEKLHDWTDEYPWTDDEILTWISLYQFSTAGPAASVRIYYETAHASREKWIKGIEYVPRVPLGISYYPKDLMALPKTWGWSSGPIVFEAVHEQGGHFASFECPEQFAADLKNMFGGGGGAQEVARKFESHL
ncbi:putative epoxide hydrolase [Tolypocladium ophioglossoides CBS 100239]|uniref:Putative epoxide hydrolase n=1 Tax=Tolypocladium ophioglossoides (strain CBS 100239) TaxID=1163406 RepID=A0A0L0MZ15_TOLOC|nr:putative epoxide hydrolase [Tolypocladium ophioglossoides CBS 100239]